MNYNDESLVERLYSLDELVEMRRNTLRFARSFPPGSECNSHRQLATSLRMLFQRQKMAADSHAARLACSVTHFISERMLARRIKLHGAHWQQKMDSGPNCALDCADR